MCGINDQQTQKKLLAEKALSFDRAMEIAIDVESATKGARDITSRTCDNAPFMLLQTRHPQFMLFQALSFTPNSCCFQHSHSLQTYVAELSKPLQELLSAKKAWLWTPTQGKDFTNLKRDLTTPNILTMYDPSIGLYAHAHT